MAKTSPVKPPTITDIAIKCFIQDLLDRGQVPVLQTLAEDLGFKVTNPIRYFLKGERNYPRAKIEQAIRVLSTKYRANKDYLRTGHGKMYKGEPYTTNDELSKVSDYENILTIGQLKRAERLEKINEELLKRIEELEQMLKDKSVLIDTQRELINAIKQKKK